MDSMQLDIFDDGREVMLANDAVQALEARNVSASKAACERLAQEFPAHDALSALFTLAGYIEESEATRHQTFSDHQTLNEARRMLDDVSAPAARRSFGEPDAVRWLALSWQSLAQRAGSLAFNGRRPQDHAAALWLRAGCWEAAAQAVAAIESWRRIPAPLAWMVEARLHLVGLQSTWPILAELAWLAPALMEEVARRASDPLLAQLLTRFEASFEPLFDAPSSELRTTHDMAWFPAWVLIERPQLREYVAPAQASLDSAPERATRLLVELLGLEREGRHAEIIARRKSLRDLQPALYAAYIRNR